MTFLGHVRNGMTVADEPATLPEGASIRIEVVIDATNQAHQQPCSRQGGLYAGKIWIAPDFDEWPELDPQSRNG